MTFLYLFEVSKFPAFLWSIPCWSFLVLPQLFFLGKKILDIIKTIKILNFLYYPTHWEVHSISFCKPNFFILFINSFMLLLNKPSLTSTSVLYLIAVFSSIFQSPKKNLFFFLNQIPENFRGKKKFEWAEGVYLRVTYLFKFNWNRFRIQLLKWIISVCEA